MRVATLDIGTNSVKMMIAERGGDGHWRTLSDEVEITRLGQDLRRTGQLAPEAMSRTLAVLETMVARARSLGVTTMVAVGTMALRTAGNAAEFIQRARRECGLTVEVIAGEDEARLSYLAVAGDPRLAAGQPVVFDVGGGSTEFIYRPSSGALTRISLPLGAVSLTETYLGSDPVTGDEVWRCLGAIDEVLDREATGIAGGGLVGIGGTLTTLAAVQLGLAPHDPERIHGTRLRGDQVGEMIDTFTRLRVAERATLDGMPPKRADVILAGALVVRLVMIRVGAVECVVSDRGVRHGLLLDRFGSADTNKG